MEVNTRRIGTRPGEPPELASPSVRYKAIVQQEWAYVRKAARRCGVPEHFRDDIAIEVFLRFQKHVATLLSPAAVRAWLRKATRLVSHEHFDTSASLYETPMPVERIKAVEQVSGVEEGYFRRERFISLLEHVDNLHPSLRKVFYAYTVDCLSIAQIGTLYDLPPSTVFNRLRAVQSELQEAVRRDREAEGHRYPRRGLEYLPLLILFRPEVTERCREIVDQLCRNVAGLIQKGLLLLAQLFSAGAAASAPLGPKLFLEQHGKQHDGPREHEAGLRLEGVQAEDLLKVAHGERAEQRQADAAAPP